MKAEFGFVNYGLSFSVTEGPKTYGKVCRKGTVYYRNYKRPVKNGYSGMELVQMRIEQAQSRLKEFCGIPAIYMGKS